MNENLRYLVNGKYVYGSGHRFAGYDGQYVTVYQDYTLDEVSVDELEIKLSNGTWKKLTEAFKDKDIIPDNFNLEFREPLNEDERFRGFYY